MNPAVSTDLLLAIFRATPETLAAIQRMLAKQRSVVFEDRETAREYRRRLDRLRAVIDSAEASGPEKEAAQEELTELEQYRKEICNRTIDGATRAARNIRQALRRVCASLAAARNEQGSPHPILAPFASHLFTHLVASSPDLPPGHLLYQPPAHVVWA